MITSVKKFMELNTNKNLKEMIIKDIFATNIYTLAYEENSCANLDFTMGLVIKQKIFIFYFFNSIEIKFLLKYNVKVKRKIEKEVEK